MISVKKQIVVETSQQRAFRTFTDGIDRWWPREHHIGASLANRVLGGRRMKSTRNHVGNQRAIARGPQPRESLHPEKLVDLDPAALVRDRQPGEQRMRRCSRRPDQCVGQDSDAAG